MPVQRTIRVDDAQHTIWDEIYTDGQGRRVGTGVSVDWKAGTVPANQQDLEDKATQALAANAAFLQLAAASNAQVVAQVQRLTRECSALIRLLLGQLDDTAGT